MSTFTFQARAICSHSQHVPTFPKQHMKHGSPYAVHSLLSCAQRTCVAPKYSSKAVILWKQPLVEGKTCQIAFPECPFNVDTTITLDRGHFGGIGSSSEISFSENNHFYFVCMGFLVGVTSIIY